MRKTRFFTSDRVSYRVVPAQNMVVVVAAEKSAIYRFSRGTEQFLEQFRSPMDLLEFAKLSGITKKSEISYLKNFISFLLRAGIFKKTARGGPQPPKKSRRGYIKPFLLKRKDSVVSTVTASFALL